jgi:hypothetical protein
MWIVLGGVQIVFGGACWHFRVDQDAGSVCFLLFFFGGGVPRGASTITLHDIYDCSLLLISLQRMVERKHSDVMMKSRL